jgi:N6-adenosine-specific RNA methylase IME4
MKYRTILADPPWPQSLMGNRKRVRDPHCSQTLPYSTMTIDEIKKLPVNDIAEVGCHLWLWTTNQFLRQGFDVMEAWGFKYLAPITWVKPSGCGNYFVHTTQTMLFGYKEKCIFPAIRFMKTDFAANPKRHSEKPQVAIDLIEIISFAPRIELFSRRKRMGWDTWGNEVYNNVELNV